MKGRLLRRQGLEGGYTVIPNTIFRRNDISAKALGVLCKLLHLPPDWRLYISEFKNHFPDGRDAVRNAIRELEELGYVRKIEVRNKSGQFKEVVWLFSDAPMSDDLNDLKKEILAHKEIQPKTDFPKSVNPKSEKQELLNTYSTNQVLINNILVDESSFIEILLKDLVTLKTLFGSFGYTAYRLKEAAYVFMEYVDQDERTLAQWYFDFKKWAASQTRKSLAHHVHNSVYRIIKADRAMINRRLEAGKDPGLLQRLLNDEQLLPDYLEKMKREREKIFNG